MIQEILNKAVEGGLYNSMRSLLDFLISNWRIIIGCYGVFIATVILRVRYTRKTLLPIQIKANQELDKLWYESSKILYNNKESLHNISENISLLLHYKTDCLSQQKSPRSMVEKFYEEYSYLCQLTSTPITLQQNDIVAYKNIMIKLQQTEKSLESILGYSTLGLSKLFI